MWMDYIRLDLGVVWTGLVWLKIETSGELFWIRSWTFGFHEMLGNYRVATQLVASRVMFSSIELVISQCNCSCYASICCWCQWPLANTFLAVCLKELRTWEYWGCGCVLWFRSSVYCVCTYAFFVLL
jgi:hypothetical protein